MDDQRVARIENFAFSSGLDGAHPSRRHLAYELPRAQVFEPGIAEPATAEGNIQMRRRGRILAPPSGPWAPLRSRDQVSSSWGKLVHRPRFRLGAANDWAIAPRFAGNESVEKGRIRYVTILRNDIRLWLAPNSAYRDGCHSF